MSVVAPIPGASESPSVERTYSALGSIDIRDRIESAGYESVEITSLGQYHAEESINVTKTTTRGSFRTVSVERYSLYNALRALNVVDGDSFTILADVLQTIFSSGSLVGAVEITAQLLVNTVEVAIKSFSFQVPTGRLGSLLNVVLADPSVASIPAGASVKFQLLITTPTGIHPYVLMDNGKLQERASTVKYKGGKDDGPVDEVTFGALDVIADKFSLAPRRPVVMYDPYRVKFDEIATRPRDAVRDERGGPILPIIEPVGGLTMKQIINRAYTSTGGFNHTTYFSPGSLGSSTFQSLLSSPANDQNGCGFTSIITNILNYRVRRADFSIEGGWHDGAQPCVAMYNPVYFVEGTKLFIIDVDRILPYGVNPHAVTLSDHKALTERIAFKPDANAILLTYQYALNDPSEDGGRLVREVFSDTVDETEGVAEGAEGYTRTETRRWDYEYYFADDPTNVLATYPKSIDISTFQTIAWTTVVGPTVTSSLYGVRLTHQETTDYTYEGELLTDTRKVVKGLVTVGAGAGMALIDVEEEQTHIVWTDDPTNPGTKLQERVLTDIYGVVVYSDNQEDVTGPTGTISNVARRIPILLAQASGVVTVDSIVESRLVPIKSIRDTLHRLNDNQFNVMSVEIDMLNNTVKRSVSQPVTGSNATNQFGSKSRTVLFRDLVSEAAIGPRIPIAINSYELPRKRAFELARNALKRIKNPLMQLPIDLPGVDFAIARGSVIKGQKRNASYTPNYIVTGYTITGQSLGKQGHRISQSLEAIQLLEAS